MRIRSSIRSTAIPAAHAAHARATELYRTTEPSYYFTGLQDLCVGLGVYLDPGKTSRMAGNAGMDTFETFSDINMSSHITLANF